MLILILSVVKLGRNRTFWVKYNETSVWDLNIWLDKNIDSTTWELCKKLGFCAMLHNNKKNLVSGKSIDNMYEV